MQTFLMYKTYYGHNLPEPRFSSNFRNREVKFHSNIPVTTEHINWTAKTNPYPVKDYLKSFAILGATFLMVFGTVRFIWM